MRRRASLVMCTTYYNGGGGASIPPVLVSLLNDSGEHCYKLAFDGESAPPRNFIFGVLVEDPLRVTICYELHELFPVHRGSPAFRRLRDSISGILGAEVVLLPFTYFERGIAKYDALYCVFRCHMHTAMFRRELADALDEKMHVVLSHWNSTSFDMPVQPPVAARCGAFFSSILNVYWYHDYVFRAIGTLPIPEYSLGNVTDARLKLAMQGGDTGKVALLEVLELAYKCAYDT